MSWIIAGSILGWLGVAAAFGLFDTNSGSAPDDDEGLGEDGGEGEGGNDVAGTTGDDQLTGNAGTVLGFAGDDNIAIFDGTAFAGDGNDTLSLFDQSVGYGDAGDDAISVNANGGAGYGGDGDDRLEADSASVTDATAAPGPAAIFGDAGFDLLSANGDALAYGGTGDDYLLGENSATLYGDEDDDVLLGGRFTNGITFASDMALFGGQGYDTLVGTEGDSLSGDDGKDVLVAGAGDATLTGGAGTDTFALQAWQLTDGQTITITDFTEGDDLALLTNGSLTAGNTYEATPETIDGNAGFTVTGTFPGGGEALRMRIELSGLTSADGIDFDIVPVDEDTFNGLNTNSISSIATLSDAINTA